MTRKKFISIPEHEKADFDQAQKEGLKRTYEREHPGLLTAITSYSFESKEGSVYKGVQRFFFEKHTTEIDFSYDSMEKTWRVTRDFND
ncbi:MULTISPECIES: hypothetical protein [Pseudomonas]|jgi:hypothetical protein|uniref:hypothetical protein n=1 Tax=Pseudomonas TaxID=286 RepID=UPI00209274D9|nr:MULTISPECIES: hypothetical protein [Pseudomonas]MCW0921432.1 hypothetical protein [Pseudomonas sp. RG1]MDF2641790.1 hypothetical protein [Pseudomonas sp.]USU03003.1 hypothetical protein NF680_12290 [Pseudomonas siliginis]